LLANEPNHGLVDTVDLMFACNVYLTAYKWSIGVGNSLACRSIIHTGLSTRLETMFQVNIIMGQREIINKLI
jgi:hypothetical protein